MSNAQFGASAQTPDRGGETTRSEIFEMLAEAGLGQGHGLEWLMDRLAGNREQGQ